MGVIIKGSPALNEMWMHKKELDPNRKHYFDKLNSQEFQDIVKSAIDEQATITLWEAHQTEQQAEEFIPLQLIQDPQTEQLKLEIQSQKSLLKQLLGSKLIDKEVFLKFQLVRFHYFSTAKLEKDNEGKLQLLIGQDIFKSQQRANYRIMASDFIQIKLTLGEQDYRALDLSSGGISLLIPAEQAQNFLPGQVHKKATLNLKQTLYNIPELRVVKANAWNEAEIQIGIQFEKLPEKVEMRLNQQINNEARVEYLLKKRSS